MRDIQLRGTQSENKDMKKRNETDDAGGVINSPSARADFLPELMSAFIEFSQKINDAQIAISRAIAPLYAAFSSAQRKIKTLEGSGFLPHDTTPWDLIPDDSDPIEISNTVVEFYTNNWNEIEDRFIARINDYAMDDEAKAVFMEALATHRHGFYRATVRLLFPEIERVARDEFYGGSLETGIASLEDIRHYAGKLPIGDVISYEFGLNLFDKINDHLYTNVKCYTEKKKAAEDAVPNRHAALHGIVPYTSFQNSVNILIMADFMFYLMDRIKKHMVTDEDGDLGYTTHT